MPGDEAREDGRDELLTIGDLAAMTGVTGAALRTWEKRFGFPEPARTVGGQRRYRSADAARVRRVVDERGRGLTLEAAIRAVVRDDEAGSGSLYAELRAAHPHLDPIRVSLRVMQALTWSIEDECLAHASRPLLFGCFQTTRTFEIAGRRWRELARSAAAAVVMSDFPRTDATTTPARVALPATSPMLNEWAVICLDPRLSVALVAWEPPRTGATGAAGGRRFEGVLSLEPDVVRDAAAYYTQVCAGLGLADLAERTGALTHGLAEDPRRSASLLRRFATYADR